MHKMRNVPARLCGHPIWIPKDRDAKVFALCKQCMARYPFLMTRCTMCGDTLAYNAITQFLYAKRGISLPSLCSCCKKDAPLFALAIRVVERKYRNQVVESFKRVSRLGFPTGALVAVLHGRRSGDLVAEVCIENFPGGKRFPSILYVTND